MRFSRKITITHPYGIHARPSSAMHQLSLKFSGEFYLKYEEECINMNDTLGLMSLGVECGEEIEVIGRGKEAKEGVEAFLVLIVDDFGLKDLIK